MVEGSGAAAGIAGPPGPSPPDPVFLALADATRRGMLERLADGPATITELRAGLPISRQAVSKHLRLLAEAGLVTDQKVGRERYYTLAAGSFAAASGWLAAVERRWDARIAALRRLVETPVEPEPEPEPEPDGDAPPGANGQRL